MLVDSSDRRLENWRRSLAIEMKYGQMKSLNPIDRKPQSKMISLCFAIWLMKNSLCAPGVQQVFLFAASRQLNRSSGGSEAATQTRTELPPKAEVWNTTFQKARHCLKRRTERSC